MRPPADQSTTYDQRRAQVIELLRDSPGGITSTEIKRIMGDLKPTALEALMCTIGATEPHWEQLDEDGIRWYHHIRWNHLYKTSASARTIVTTRRRNMPRKKASSETSRTTVYIETQVYHRMRRYLADRKETIGQFLTAAIEEKLSRDEAKS